MNGQEPWYKVVTARKEVREGRSFNPDEFAIALEQVVAGKAPEDYKNPEKFFARTYFTRALLDHSSQVLRRLAGETANTAPVLTLVTQFGGGKTHTLASLFHLMKADGKAAGYPGVDRLLRHSGLAAIPKARVAVFVGNAWDPSEKAPHPWIDIARQLAGEPGVKALGDSARTVPPGTEAIGRMFEAAGGAVLVLCDEVLNFMNRHRAMAEPFHAFIQNLTVAMTGTQRGAAVISLPRSQVEMTEWDQAWQEKITKVVTRVAKALIANDEAEVSEVVRRRLFEDLGDEKLRRRVAKAYADWCFERRDRLPSEWMAVDTSTTEAKAKEFLQQRFEACYPFHPATLSVFQRKWQTLPQYQQTRGTLAMLAQWIAWAQREGFAKARKEPLITLGSAPLEVADFRSVVLGQLGESRLLAGIDVDIAGEHAHARALDADTRGGLREIHRRVGTAILFESSGGQADKSAHLPELRFALGEPEVETTSVDNAAHALEQRAYYVRRVGTDGYQIRYQPTLKKVVNDKRASLDEERDTRPATLNLVKAEFERGRTVPMHYFPESGAEVADSPRLMIVVGDPAEGWSDELRARVAEWTKSRGASPRLYPGALVWCFMKRGRELRNKVEEWLAWRRVKAEIDEGILGGDFDRGDRTELVARVKEAEEAARDGVWASYRFVAVADAQEEGGLKAIDLGAGHSSTSEPLCGRVLAALKAEGLLNESVGASYLERNWPNALKAAGAWPLAGLRQSFLNGSLTRLLDPDAVLRRKIVEFVTRAELGLASGPRPDGTYDRVWFDELLPPDEITFDAGVFLLTKATAKALRAGSTGAPEAAVAAGAGAGPMTDVSADAGQELRGLAPAATVTLKAVGVIPPELWNRLGMKLIPKLKGAGELQVGVSFEVKTTGEAAARLRGELQQLLEELGLASAVRVEVIE